MNTKNEQNDSIMKILLVLLIFGISFGFIEGSVAHYLRMHFYPEGFNFTIKSIDKSILIIEMFREIATLILISCTAYLTSNILIIRITNFIYIFSIWDIIYYCTLYFIEGWPKNLFSWDVLFLIPVPWFSPVIAPITISSIGILGSIIINYLYKKNKTLRINLSYILLFFSSLILWFSSFVNYESYDKFPDKYNWLLFCFGNILSVFGLINLYISNKYPDTRIHLKIFKVTK